MRLDATTQSIFDRPQLSAYAELVRPPGCEQVSEENNKYDKKSRWVWGLSLLATSLAGAAVFVFRGCWHNKMSWPVRSQGYSYQVCTNCGIKRLFDEQAFCSYGPYSYEIERLIAWEQEQREKTHRDVA
jgi:hypothetical protein